MQRALVAQRYAQHRTTRRFAGLADGFRHFARLAMTEADLALLIADDHERRETEALAALHNLRDAVDVDELLGEIAFAIVVAVPISGRIACHVDKPFSLRSSGRLRGPHRPAT